MITISSTYLSRLEKKFFYKHTGYNVGTMCDSEGPFPEFLF